MINTHIPHFLYRENQNWSMNYHKVQPCAIYKVECVRLGLGSKALPKTKKKGLCEVSPQLNDLPNLKACQIFFMNEIISKKSQGKK
jgi:hypothetical protein